MPWDEELERLVHYVRDLFGDRELKAASARALTTLTPVNVVDDCLCRSCLRCWPPPIVPIDW